MRVNNTQLSDAVQLISERGFAEIQDIKQKLMALEGIGELVV